MRSRMMFTGVMRETTKLMGTRESRRAAWPAVRGKPSRMNDAKAELERGEGQDEVAIGSHSLAVSSDTIRRSIVSSGTRLPERIAPPASRPDLWISLEI